jgi:hypothetical protein
LKIASDKKAVNDKAAKAARDEAEKAKAMKDYDDKLAKIEAEIKNVRGWGAAGKRKELEAKKEAHIKTKPK